MYKASYVTNNGSTHGTFGPYANKMEARKIIRRICKGNTFAGNVGLWEVRKYHIGSGATIEIVYSGKVK